MKNKKHGKKYMHRILECYEAFNLKMKLDFINAVGDFFIFRIEFIPGTTEKKIRRFIEDVRQTLGVELFQLYREKRDLYFILSEGNAFNTELLGILTSSSYTEYTKNMTIPYPIGFNAVRKPVVVDLVLYFSWLLGGASNSGKTTGIQCLISGILWSCSPEHVNLVIIDVAANLTQFAALPHLSCPVIQDEDAGHKAIIHLHAEMEQRLKLKGENPEKFNLQPIIVCIIDECVSFVAGTSNKQKSRSKADTISKILRLGRHAKIYLVLATQNAALEDLVLATQNAALEEMKCDLSPVTSRIAFKCGKPLNSVTILGEGGAEKLAGKGEMYFKSQNHPELMYVKGALVTTEEIEKICSYIRKKYEVTEWDKLYKFTIDTASLLVDEEDTSDALTTNSVAVANGIEDECLAKIIIWALRRETISANAINYDFSEVGHRKASKILEKLFELSVVEEQIAKLGRKVHPTRIEDLSKKVVNLLYNNGYTLKDIKETFNARQNNSGGAEGEKVLGVGE